MTATETAPDVRERLSRWPAIWLRDNCQCPQCRDPRNDQKLFGITDLPIQPSVLDISTDGTLAFVEFEPRHRGVYPLAWLRSIETAETAGHPGDDRSEAGKRLWRAADFADGPPNASWADYLASPAERLRCLAAVRELGFVLLRGVPAVENTVLEVVESFGYVRRTNYGEIFDVHVVAEPNNLAFTSQVITPHTDNPYRDPVPTAQVLHCLQNSAEGGDSGLVDGFTAAALLRDEAPDAFDVLIRTPVPFQFADSTTVLRADRPMIDVDPAGRIREVRFNNRSMRPVTLPPDQLADFYSAYRRFAEVITRPELQLEFRLEPGDCLVFDNVRLLHARTAYSDTGGRHLQGCYADLDSLYSAEAVLRRQVNA
ncbi:MAG TPA: TauD/TfdA family dioxygenase [Pseudonocardia sp.]|nr:TauD/TfdA family dioxygenase [Pseudonocardia sp.]